MDKSIKIFIITGETSGDLNASFLITDLSHHKNVNIFGIGGNYLSRKGVNMLFNYEKINYVGFYNVAVNIRKIKHYLSKTVNHILENHYDAVILVDTPGFNLQVAKQIRNKFKGKIIYYISPQIWAWHEKRVKLIRKLINKIIVIFPFEIDYYKKFGIDVVYSGNPVAKRISDFLKNNSRKTNLNPVITIMPGSRIQEIKSILPLLYKAADEIRKKFVADIKVLKPNYIDDEDIYCIANSRNFNIISSENENNLRTILNSDFILTKIGTSTLECGLIGTPFATVYKTNLINYHIAKSLFKLNYVSLVNILLNRQVVKEYIQSEMTVQNLSNEAYRVLSDDAYRNRMKSLFSELWGILDRKDIEQNAAEVIINEINK